MTRLPRLVLEAVRLALSEVRNRFVVALLATSFLAVTSPTSFCGTPESLIDAIDAMKHSIVPIVYVTVQQGGSHEYDGIEGTGFFIGKDGFLLRQGTWRARFRKRQLLPTKLRKSLRPLGNQQ